MSTMTRQHYRALYNGHKNWNHWNVSLWINNDEGLYLCARDHVRNCSGSKSKAAQNMLVPDRSADANVLIVQMEAVNAAHGLAAGRFLAIHSRLGHIQIIPSDNDAVGVLQPFCDHRRLFHRIAVHANAQHAPVWACCLALRSTRIVYVKIDAEGRAMPIEERLRATMDRESLNDLTQRF